MLATGMSGEDKDLARARAARKLLRRLEARTRLEQLAASPPPATQGQRELERLKHYYLPMWAEQRRRDAIERGLPTEVPFTEYMKGSMREFDETDWWKKIDGEACALVDQAIDELVGAGGFRLARAVLAVRYLNAASAAVYRNGRVQDLEPRMVEDLCDRAERQLVPIVKRRGLLL